MADSEFRPHTATRKFASLGECIYCRKSEDLRDEHIVPESLGGRLVFKKASCHECEKKTHAFEGRLISQMYGSARAVLGMHRGKKRKWPPKFAVVSDEHVIEVDLAGNPGTIPCD